jgi:hypothetical protein
MAQTADIDTPASSDERVEDFAEFLDSIENEDPVTGDVPADGAVSDPSGTDAPGGADEPEDPAIVPPVSWGQDATELFETSPESTLPRVVLPAASTMPSAHLWPRWLPGLQAQTRPCPNRAGR